jgi:hypothetical protein
MASYYQSYSFDNYSCHYSNHSLFFRPRLKIEFDPRRNQNTFAPSHGFGGLDGYTQRYLRVLVRNKGHRSLHNCQAELRILIPKNTSENDLSRYPSDEPKLLAWGRHPQSLEPLSCSMNIQANSGRLLHVVFSDSDFANMNIIGPRRYACISTIDRLQVEPRPAGQANNLRVEDSFTDGEFIIEISVTSDEGPYKISKFLVTIGTDWSGLKMRKISRLERLSVFMNKVRRTQLK